jgi:hypothetical protein
MGSKWKDVGSTLGFSVAQLDQLESDGGGNLQDCTEKLLFRWMLWKSDRAFVKRLSNALYSNGEHGAILAIKRKLFPPFYLT